MKFIITLILAFLALPLWAQAEKKSLGIMIGNPTGLNGKYWIKKNQAVDAGLGWSFGRHTNFSFHSDFLVHAEDALIFNDNYHLDVYFGLGGRMEFARDIEVGLRIPVGVAHQLENGVADVFMEVAPIWDFVSRTGLELHFLIGSRYYF